jgi:hypothetical protein
MSMGEPTWQAAAWFLAWAWCGVTGVFFAVGVLLSGVARCAGAALVGGVGWVLGLFSLDIAQPILGGLFRLLGMLVSHRLSVACAETCAEVLPNLLGWLAPWLGRGLGLAEALVGLARSALVRWWLWLGEGLGRVGEWLCRFVEGMGGPNVRDFMSGWV